MTIGAWIFFAIFAVGLALIAFFVASEAGTKTTKIAIIIALCIVIAGMFAGLRAYYKYTASGQRALTDQNSNLSGGIERTIIVYTADGKIIARYEGKIDLEPNDGGYVKFDYQGKRYIYYNCFVESIAEIGGK